MGKLSFVLRLVFYAGLLLLNYPKPNLGRDGAMGYGLGSSVRDLVLSKAVLVCFLAWHALGYSEISFRILFGGIF